MQWLSETSGEPATSATQRDNRRRNGRLGARSRVHRAGGRLAAISGRTPQSSQQSAQRLADERVATADEICTAEDVDVVHIQSQDAAWLAALAAGPATGASAYDGYATNAVIDAALTSLVSGRTEQVRQAGDELSA